MPEFVIGLRSKDDEIHFIRVKAQGVALHCDGEGPNKVWKAVGESGGEVLIDPDAFVFAGPKEMITDLG